MTTDTAPVFVVSTGRAGSQMLASVFGLHPSCLAFHELRPTLNVAAKALWSSRLDDQAAADLLRAARGDLIGEATRHGLVFVESSHFMSHFIPLLYSEFDARFVFLHRDGREFVESGLERPWYQSRGLAHQFRAFVRDRAVWEVGSPYEAHRLSPPRGAASRLEKIAWLWSEVNSVILRALDQVPAERWLTLPLAELSTESVRGAFTFSGLDPNGIDPNELASRLNRPVNVGGNSRPTHEDWSVAQRQAFDRYGAEMMRQLGYYTTKGGGEF